MRTRVPPLSDEEEQESAVSSSTAFSIVDTMLKSTPLWRITLAILAMQVP
jgi:hypothetical protein